jgi:hypothetical protein
MLNTYFFNLHPYEFCDLNQEKAFINFSLLKQYKTN